MEIIAYVKDYGEKIFIGTFESLENIHDEVEIKMDDLGLSYMITGGQLKRPIYIVQGTNEYKLIWGSNR
ncbi:hypothetical protein [Enterococcus raffinosus]|uniref:hypothetical protein n=1 Tax=Enterococcus raffinosus TaxID=71452 RepID=UPI003DA4A130